MKNKLFYIPLLALTLCSACSDDDLDDTSVIVTSETEQTEFDKWLQVNFVAPYNIQFVYRYVDNETDMNYYQVPADYDQAVELAHIVKYTCIEAYDEVAGTTFTRRYFPKMFYLSGTWEYRNNGTFILGTAEGGKKIFLAGVNFLDEYKDNVTSLNYYYLKTIHHEFTHILNQTIDYPTSFQEITGSEYVADSWSESPYDTDYLTRGFISAYSQNSATEDFAEMLSMYITNTEEQWEAWMTEAGTDGATLLQQKLDIVRSYMQDSWGIDIDELRSTVL
jgi:substrate import-associated zinc metallohydrolase lipoprotein